MIKLERSFNIDNAQLLNLHPNKWVKSRRLAVINNIKLSVFNNSNCVQGLTHCKKGKLMNSQGYKYFRGLLINMLEKGGVTFIEHGSFLIITADAPKRM